MSTEAHEPVTSNCGDLASYWKAAHDLVVAQNWELSRQIDALQKVGEQCLRPQQTPTGEGERIRGGELELLIAAQAARKADLAHPQQGGERDGWKPIAEARHDCTLYELEVPSDGKGLRDAETSITIGSNNGDHDGEDRWTYAGWSWCQDRYIHMDTADGAPMPIRFREIRPDHLGHSASEPDPAVAPSDEPDLSYSGAPMPPDGIEGCVYCGQPFKEGDLVLDEVDGGRGHAACCGPDRESYVGADGDPLKDDEPIPAGYSWTPTSPSKSSGEEA